MRWWACAAQDLLPESRLWYSRVLDRTALRDAASGRLLPPLSHVQLSRAFGIEATPSSLAVEAADLDYEVASARELLAWATDAHARVLAGTSDVTRAPGRCLLLSRLSDAAHNMWWTRLLYMGRHVRSVLESAALLCVSRTRSAVPCPPCWLNVQTHSQQPHPLSQVPPLVPDELCEPGGLCRAHVGI